MNDKTLQVLNGCTIDGNNVRLPEGQLDRKDYEGVKKALEGIGGKWKGGKIMAFVFPHDPTERMAQIQGGEKVNLQKQYQFFATPSDLANKLVEMAEITEPCNILEPSAGDGAIVKAIKKKFPTLTIDVCEIMPENIKKLEELQQEHDIRIMFTSSDESNFLNLLDVFESEVQNKYDRIIANPPFTQNQDIEHINLMYQMLAPKGRIVAMASNHYAFANDKPSVNFREFLKSVGAKEYDVPAGSFKQSGTMVATKIIVINKP